MARPKRKRKWRNGSLRSLAVILDGDYPGRKEDRTLIRTFSWWERAVSRRIAEVAQPVKLLHGTLLIHTRSSAWAQELSFHEEDLLASVREVTPKVKRIRIRVGPMPPRRRAPDPRPPKIEPLPARELPGDVARALAHLGDDGLRDAVRLAACTSLAPGKATE